MWRRHWRLALLLAVAGLAYGRGLGAYGMLMWDEAEYASLARALARGEGYTVGGRPEALRPPLLPLAGAAAIALAGRADDRVVKAATVALALAALLVVYAAGTRAYDRTTGLVAALLLAAVPWFWTATAQFLSELPLLACFSAAAFAWSFALLRAPGWFHLAWLCAGLALLTRYTALLLGPLFALLTLAALVTHPAAVRRCLRSPHAWLAPLVAVAVVAPWFAHQALTFGDPLVGLRRASGQLQVYLPGVSMPWHAYLSGLPAMLTAPTLAALVLGVAWAVWRRDAFALHCVVVVAFVLLWFSAYRYKEPRLVSAMLPAAALLAAVGVTRGLTGDRPQRLGLAVAGALLGVVALGALSARDRLSRFVTNGYPSFLQAAEFLRAHSEPSALVVAPNPPQVWWYAERRVEEFPAEAALPALLARADWVVIADFERGQPPYAAALAARIPASAFVAGDAARFDDGRFSTVVARAALLR